MPPLQGWQACIADASWALSPAMQDDCRAALVHVVSADTLIQRMVATGMLETMARDDRQGSKSRRVHRELRWLQVLQLELGLQFGARVIGMSMAQGEYNMLKAHAIRTNRWPPPDRFPVR